SREPGRLLYPVPSGHDRRLPRPLTTTGTGDCPMKLPARSTVIRVFRALAVAEGFSWAALLVGMFLKWVLRLTELGVEIAGPVHGAFFIGYGLAALALWRLQRWPFRVALFAGLSA